MRVRRHERCVGSTASWRGKDRSEVPAGLSRVLAKGIGTPGGPKRISFVNRIRRMGVEMTAGGELIIVAPILDPGGP
jgi:hypothetical protein